MVLHPDHVGDWDFLCTWDIPWGIENLDARNTYFGTPDELTPLMLPRNLPLVLDINHCYTHDSSLSLARSFQEHFARHIVEQHVSGYRDAGDTGRHLPVCETKQVEMCEVLDPTIPTIIEIDETTPEILAQEFAFVWEHTWTQN